HPVGDDLDRAALLSLVLPGAVPKPALQRNLPPLCEVFGAQLRLAVPHDDLEEVRFGVLAVAVDREPERRSLLVLSELAELHLGGEVAGQVDAVHRFEPPLSMRAT